jgi:hypothetical protein
MTARKTKLTLREQIEHEKIKIWDLYCKSRVQEALENTKDREFRDMYDTYMSSFRYWGGVEFVFWLQALAKKCKSYNSELESIAIFSLPKGSRSDAYKIKNLQVIAKQMGLDVAITSNRPLKPARVSKPRTTTPKAKRGPGERGAHV